MRNLGEESFFYKSFYLSQPYADSWLISADAKLSASKKNNVESKILFRDINNRTLAGENVSVRVTAGKKNLFRNDLQVGSDGVLSSNFDLPDDKPINSLNIIVAEKRGGQKHAVIPVVINRAQDIDLQFMAEGGQLVSLLPVNVGFKAIGEDGRGIDVKGVILDNDKKEVANFESSNKGMGLLRFTPQFGQSYTARVTLANGDSKTVNLPPVKDSGTLLQLKNELSSDSVDVSIIVSDDLVRSGKDYHLIGTARNVVCYGASINFKANTTIFHIAKNAFPTGILHFTLLNDLNQPVNERLTFINHNDNLKIDIKTGKGYITRDSINMIVKVTDEAGNPVSGSFSMAITDNKQVKRDGDSNILTSTLLTSDLKGYVEDVPHYFKQNDKSWADLDVLLLTQGWIGYNWNTILNSTAKTDFAAEPEFTIKGKLNNLMNKPIADAQVILMGTGKYTFYNITATDANGKFIFNKLPLIMDSTRFVLKATNKKGKQIVDESFKLEEVEPAPVIKLYNTPVKPWYINTDSTLLNYININKIYQTKLRETSFNSAGRLLKAVTIKDKAAIKNSQNLNGAGQYDQAITTQQLENAGRISLLDIISQKVKGFHTKNIPQHGVELYIYSKMLHFVIDGIDIERFFSENQDMPITNEHYEYVKQTLDYISVEDVLGIEVLYSQRFTNGYITNNASPNEKPLKADQLLAPMGSPNRNELAYIEITTRQGKGPMINRSQGLYIFRPVALNIPQDFYRPRYKVKNIPRSFTDMRSTIYWQQQIFTDSNGRASLSFYAADNPTTYTAIIEGGDMNGKIGYQTIQIPIGK